MKSLILLALVAALHFQYSSARVVSFDQGRTGQSTLVDILNRRDADDQSRLGEANFPVYQGFYTITYGPAVPVGPVAAPAYRADMAPAWVPDFSKDQYGRWEGQGSVDSEEVEGRLGEANFPVYQGFYTITYGPAVPVGPIAAPAYRSAAVGASSSSSSEEFAENAGRSEYKGNSPYILRAETGSAEEKEGRLGEANFPVYQGFYTITYGPAVPVGPVAAPAY